MRHLVAAALAALVLVPADLAAQSSSEADKVKAVLLTQARLLREGRFRLMYRTTYTPNFRAHCQWPRYVRRQRYGRNVTGPGFTVRNLSTCAGTARLWQTSGSATAIST